MAPGQGDAVATGFREDVEKNFSSISQLLRKAMDPIHPQFVVQPANDPVAVKGSMLADLRELGFSDVQTLIETFYSNIKGVMDDKDMVMEKLIQIMAKLPADSRSGATMSSAFINKLWTDLPHPPTMSLGKEFKYRDADGANNNINLPNVGKARTPYARSVSPQVMQNTALPDPGDIFDMLLSRGDKFTPHPNGISSMLFYQAIIIIHDCFRTDHVDMNISNTSSYLDLAPLYGSDWEEQKLMRTFQDGKLKPDCFSEKRILGFPPGVGALLIMYNRFHNYVVTNLALINENKRFSKPTGDPDEAKVKEALAKYDNDLFQTGRLITCGLYVNVILKDYVRTILSLNRTTSLWDLDPRNKQTASLLQTTTAEGLGNQVSVEFNLIYRWHAVMSQRDDKWTQAEYKRLFPDTNPMDVGLHQLIDALKDMEERIPDDPTDRSFANLARQKDGNFDDDSLVDILTASIEDVAGAFGANHVPDIMRSIEVLGILQARRWNIGTLNELRSFFGLSRYTTFEQINPDPKVADALRNLYDAPDSVEMYPGLLAEKTKPPMEPGSGLCVNYTTSRAILSDATALVRGDRFYTKDYTPKALTNWGFAAANYDLTVDSGHVMYKLFYRAFPQHFKGDSIYAHFPFVLPSENQKIHRKLGTSNKYSWDKPKREPLPVIIHSYAAATKILADKAMFNVTWGIHIEYLVAHPGQTFGRDYCLAGDTPACSRSRQLVRKGLYPDGWTAEVKEFYTDITRKLIKQYSYRVGRSRQVDIVRDVAGLANTHFSASLFSLPMKTDDNPHGIYTEQEMQQVLSILFMCIFYDIDPCQSFLLRNTAQTLAQQLGQLVMFNVEAVAHAGLIMNLVSKFHKRSTLSKYGIHMVERLLSGGMNVKEVVWSQLLPTAAAMVANQAQLFSQVLDYYLGEGSQYLPELYRLANQDTTKADDLLTRYFLEGGRLRGTAGLFRTPTTDTSVLDTPFPATPSTTSQPIKLSVGSKILVNMVHASRDPLVFPEPDAVRLDRPLNSYIHYGHGPHICAGMDASKVALTAMFKEVVRLPGLRRAKGEQGEIRALPAAYGYTSYLSADGSMILPLPASMKICWDEVAENGMKNGIGRNGHSE